MPDYDLNQPETIQLTVHPGERQARTVGQPVLAGQCCCCCCCLHSIGAVIGAAIAPAVGNKSKGRYNQEQRDYHDDFDEELPVLPRQRGRYEVEDDYEDEYPKAPPRKKGTGRRAIGIFWIWTLFGTMLSIVICTVSTAQGNVGAGEAIAINLLLVFIFYPLVILAATILSAISIGILPAEDKPKQFGVLLKIFLGGVIGTVCGCLVMAFFPLLAMIFR